MGEQQENLERVTARIGVAIVNYFKLKLAAEQPDFHVEELRLYVRSQVGMVAPASSDRVMRALRQQGFINYRVTSRKDSLYHIEKPARIEPPPWWFNGSNQGELF